MAVATRPPATGQRAVLGAVGVFLVLGAWQLIGVAEVFGDSWPRLTEVVAQLTGTSRWPLYQRALTTTVREASIGFVIGSAAAVTLAVVTSLWTWGERGASRFAVLVEAIPIIALGPLFITTLPRWVTPIAIATIAVFFTTFVATTTGLSTARPQHVDVIRVLGGGRYSILWRLRLPYALPMIVEGLKLGAPAAVLGAIVGEWFGTEQGIGPLLITSMQNYRIPQLWAAGVVGAIPSMVAYGLLALLHRSTLRRYAD